MKNSTAKTIIKNNNKEDFRTPIISNNDKKNDTLDISLPDINLRGNNLNDSSLDKENKV